jgi:HlyD family secretion protein
MKKLNKALLALLVLSMLALCSCKGGNSHAAQGYVEGRYTYVASQMSGTLLKRPVERGDQVKKGQSLFNLELDPQLAEYNQAQSDLKNAKATLADLEKTLKRPSELAAIVAQQKQIVAQLAFAKKTTKRYRELEKKGFIQKESLDKAIADQKKLEEQLKEYKENLKTGKLQARIDQIDAAKATVQAKQATLKKAKWQLDQKSIAAPVTGEVFDTYFRIGEMVPPNQPVLSILAPANIYAIFFIPERNLAKLKIGQSVKITYDNESKSIAAKVSYISPEAEFTPPVIYSEKTRDKLIYRIEAISSLTDAVKLHPGQPITVDYGSNNGK